MSDEKQKRIERRHWKQLQSIVKEIKKLQESFAEWKDEICNRDEVNCWPDQLLEGLGKIIGDDIRYTENGLPKSGDVRRLPKELFAEVNAKMKEAKELGVKLDKKLDGIADIYGTYPDLIDIKTGVVTEHETLTATEETDGPAPIEEDEK